MKVRGAVGAAFAGAEGVSSDALWKLLSELSTASSTFWISDSASSLALGDSRDRAGDPFRT